MALKIISKYFFVNCEKSSTFAPAFEKVKQVIKSV